MHRRGLAIGALVVMTLFVATACSSSSTTTSAAGSTSSSQGETPVDVSGKSSAAMQAENFFFSPSTLEGTAGQKLTITLDNAGSVPHNFSITDQNIDVTLEPGQTKDIQVTFPQSGSVQFFCSFHQSSGMVGQLEVM
jgi:plastocyanin